VKDNDRETGKNKVAFVLSGGGSLGSVQVGMIKALFEHGIVPDFFVGSSVGAINAAFICGNPTMEGVLILERIWLSVKGKDIFPTGLVSSVIRILRNKSYLISNHGLRRLLENHLPYASLGETKITCLLIATDILTGEQVVLTSGNIVDAVLASSALPGIFPTMELAGRFLFDGSISSNTPLSVAAEYGAKEVFILPAGYVATLQKKPSGVVNIFLHSLNILMGQQFFRDIEFFRNNINIHILPPIKQQSTFFNDLSKTEEYLSVSYRSTKQWLESGGMKTFKIPGKISPPNQWL
jgi:NTE family protein